MDNIKKIKKEIKNLKIAKSILKVSTTACTYKLGTIIAFEHMHLISKASPMQIKETIIGFCILDAYFTYNYWQCDHEIDKLNKTLVKGKRRKRLNNKAIN